MSVMYILNMESNSKVQNLLNIQIDHIPISLHMSGSLDGKMRLKDRAPPSNIEA